MKKEKKNYNRYTPSYIGMGFPVLIRGSMPFMPPTDSGKALKGSHNEPTTITTNPLDPSFLKSPITIF